jgi:hypothetical protein
MKTLIYDFFSLSGLAVMHSYASGVASKGPHRLWDATKMGYRGGEWRAFFYVA